MRDCMKWQLWSAEQVVQALPELVKKVEAHLEDFPEEVREKDRAAIQSLCENPPSPDEVHSGVRDGDLITIGFALDVVARQYAKEGNLEDSLDLFQAAHELFRAGRPLLRPTKPMRHVLSNALRTIVVHEVHRATRGETYATDIRDLLKDFVISAWGSIPEPLALSINERLLTELERVRVEREGDQQFQEQFVRDNVETVLTLEIPSRLKSIQDRWQEIGEHVAPAAVRMAQRTLRRPERLSNLLPQEVWQTIRQSVTQGDVEALSHTVSQVEDAVETNLRLRLDAEAEYREPASEVRFRRGPDRFFIEARELLLRQDPQALEKFKNIHYHKPQHTIVKEWYAYALSKFGQATDIYDIIKLLEDAIASRYFREDLGWTARWNLACALRRVPPRADEALDILLPVLKSDFHAPEAFELSLLWALEQEREDVLPALLLKSPYYEAHLLAALYDAESVGPEETPANFWHHFRRINRILQDPDRVFPDPKERLSGQELDQLTRDFIETSLVDAGVEWFRQRLFYPGQKRYYKNWDCARRLNEEAGDLDAAWRCLERQWECTRRSRKVRKEKKADELRSLLYWAESQGFEDDALRVLRKGWRDTSMSESDVRFWEQRLARTRVTTEEPEEPPTEQEDVAPEPEQPSPALTAKEAERVIQQVAPLLRRIKDVRALAVRADDVEQLLLAVRSKQPEMPDDTVSPIREVVRLAVTFHKGVDEERGQALALKMEEQLDPLRAQQRNLPYELQDLALACERVAESFPVRIRAIPELSITPPSDLRFTLDHPAASETYHTRIFARLTNPASEDAHNLRVAFMSPSPCVRFSEEEITVPVLERGEKLIAECPMEVSEGVGDTVEIRVHVIYDIAGIRRTSHASGNVPVRPIGAPIPVTERYVTLAPVGPDRKDLFHGRDKELADLLDAFAGGQLRKLYFVNGIRRVGKSSLMQHLGSRCGPQVLPLLLNVEKTLGGQRMNSAQFVRQLIRQSIEQLQKMSDLSPGSLSLPGAEAFELDPPWVVLDLFLKDLKRQTQRPNILLCFDEVQRLVMRIADPEDPMDEGFLSWLRGKVQAGSDTLLVCTGSEPYALMRKRYENHTVWGNIEPYNVSFVDKAAMKKIATLCR